MRNLRLSTKLVLFSTLLTLGVVALSFVAVSLEVRRQTKELLAGMLGRQQATIRRVQEGELQQLLRSSTLLTDSPTLRAAMETYRAETDAGGAPRADLLATIRAEAEQVAATLGRDLLVITDPRGRVLAAVGRSGIRPTIGEDLSSRSIVRRALRQRGPVDRDNLAVLELDGEYFQVGAVPMLLQGFLIGSLTLGDHIDERYIARLRESFDAEVLLAVGERVITASIERPLAGMTLTGLLDRPAADADPRSTVVRLGDEEFVAAPLQLAVDDEGRPVRLVLLDSLTQALASSSRSLLAGLPIIGLVAVALAGGAAAVMSRSVLRPLRRFVEFMRGAATDHDPARRFAWSGTSHEIGILVETYGQLMQSLQEHQGELLRRAQEDLDKLERLKESEKLAALGRMLSGAAHEINNPLTGVVGNIDLLLGEPRVGDAARERLQTMRRDGQRIVALVRNLLKIAHRTTTERTSFEVDGALREAVALRQHDFTAAGIRLRLELEARGALAHGNELELQQVFLNIVNNAYDALAGAGPDPELRLRSCSRDGRVIVQFTDNGPGLRDPARVFEHFYTTKPVGQGTGLGLSICHAVVRGHGGAIRAENVPGAGARFTIELPQVAGQPAAAGPRATEAQPRVERRLPASVLVVDDEPSVLDLQLTILDSLGASAVSATSGAEAIERLEQQDFDLVVSDLRMPGRVSGRDLFQWVEAHRPGVKNGFLFVTGDTIAEAGFLELTRTRCVLKPFTLEEYVAALQEALHATRHA